MHMSLLHRWRKSRTWGSYRITRDLSGRTFVVTGANTGLGRDAATALAAARATVVLACRNIKFASKVADDIRYLVYVYCECVNSYFSRCRVLTKNPEVFSMRLDLASLDSVRSFADELNHKFTSIDCLICNAGVVVPMDKVETFFRYSSIS